MYFDLIAYVWQNPWTFIIAVNFVCLFIFLVIPIPFDYWETDWIAISMYLTACVSIPAFFCGVFMEYQGLNSFNWIGTLLLMMSTLIISVLRLIYRMSKNYPTYAGGMMIKVKEEG